MKLKEFMNSEYSRDKWYFVVKSWKRFGGNGTTWYQFTPGHHRFNYEELYLIDEFGEARLTGVDLKEMYGGYSVVLTFRIDGHSVFFYTLDRDNQVFVDLSQDFVDWLKAWMAVDSLR